MVGEQIGKYKVIEKIGEGGMGSVFLAEHVLLGRPAAIKVLNKTVCSNTEIIDRFFNEARAATTIMHPGIVEIYDYGHRDDGSAYIVMEYLQGESLKARIKRLGVVPTDTALVIIRQTAAALGAAHAVNIVHRDVKPENIFLIEDADVIGGERVRVLDFGIAKMSSSDTKSNVHTRTDSLMGTPLYMSPEQCKGAGHVDTRTDLYALGCILFEMLCGRPPFRREGAGATMAAHIYEDPPAPSSIQPSMHPAVESLIGRLLAKDPAQRVGTASELIAAIEALGLSALNPPAFTDIIRSPRLDAGLATTGDNPGSASTLTGAVRSVVSQTPSIRGSRRGVIAVTAGLVGAAAIAMAVWLTPGGANTPRSNADDHVATTPDPKTPSPTAAEIATTATSPHTAAGTLGPVPVARKVTAESSAEPTPAVSNEPAPNKPVPDRLGKIAIAIESTPPGASVYRQYDGVLIGKTPHTLRMTAVEGDLELVVKLAGYEPQTVVFATQSSSRKRLVLKRDTQRRVNSHAPKRRPQRERSPKKPPKPPVQPMSDDNEPLNPFDKKSAE